MIRVLVHSEGAQCRACCANMSENVSEDRDHRPFILLHAYTPRLHDRKRNSFVALGLRHRLTEASSECYVSKQFPQSYHPLGLASNSGTGSLRLCINTRPSILAKLCKDIPDRRGRGVSNSVCLTSFENKNKNKAACLACSQNLLAMADPSHTKCTPLNFPVAAIRLRCA